MCLAVWCKCPYYHKKFGLEDNRTESMVLSIGCKKEDADYLKTLLTEAYGQEDFSYGQFVTHGILQTKGPATYPSILRAQNKFINNHSVIVIKGMTAEAFAMQFFTDSGETKRIDNYFEEDLDVEAIEQSVMTPME
eukprot:3723765-Ditylum_brightwellii.AAC.1